MRPSLTTTVTTMPITITGTITMTTISTDSMKPKLSGLSTVT